MSEIPESTPDAPLFDLADLWDMLITTVETYDAIVRRAGQEDGQGRAALFTRLGRQIGYVRSVVHQLQVDAAAAAQRAAPASVPARAPLPEGWRVAAPTAAGLDFWLSLVGPSDQPEARLVGGLHPGSTVRLAPSHILWFAFADDGVLVGFSAPEGMRPALPAGWQWYGVYQHSREARIAPWIAAADFDLERP